MEMAPAMEEVAMETTVTRAVAAVATETGALVEGASEVVTKVVAGEAAVAEVLATAEK